MKNKLPKLNKGDTICLVDPSGRVRNHQDVYDFKSFLERNEFKVIIAPHILDGYKYLAGTDIDRANDLMDAFKNDEVKAILSYKGGYGCQRIIPYLDFEEIKKHPKLFMGFSDITVFLNIFNQLCNFPTIHGEMGVCVSHTKFDDKNIITNDNLIHTLYYGFDKPIKNNLNELEVINEGIVEGELVGGNLSLVDALRGTPYEVDLDGKILFIEDVHEDPYSVDRMLSSLLLSGKLNKVKGIICGYFTDCGSDTISEEDFTVKEILLHYLKPLNVPLVLGFESGHDKPFNNIPIGLKVRLDTYQKSVIVLESLFIDN